MTIEHKNIPDSGRHEPKGISTAPLGSVYVANGTGGGSWQPLTAARVSVVSKTANYTAVEGDSVILVDASAGAVIITLPTASTVSGQKYTVKKTDSSANPVTASSAQGIDGDTTQVLRKKGQSVDAVSFNNVYHKV